MPGMVWAGLWFAGGPSAGPGGFPVCRRPCLAPPGHRVRVLEGNLRRVIGAQAPGGELRAPSRQAMRSYARYRLEAFRLPVMPAARLAAGMRDTGHIEAAFGYLAAGRGVVFALAQRPMGTACPAWASMVCMPVGDYEESPRVRSWITPKAVKGGPSAIAGRGVHAAEVIAGGEVVAVKGGHLVDGAAVAGLPEALRDAAFPITADMFVAALTRGEYDGVLMRVDHSCEPNVGMGGNVVLVAVRQIAAGEELTIDYALFLGDPGFAMACRCGTAACRGMVTGTDWMRADLQDRYRGWFSWWLQQKIAQAQDNPSR